MMNDDWRLTGNPVRVSRKSASLSLRDPREREEPRWWPPWVPALAGMTTQVEPVVPFGEAWVVGTDLAGT